MTTRGADPFDGFQLSRDLASIYYLDLFRINGRVWAIGGHGKSEAARIASGKRRADDLARDSVALVRDGSALHGRYDPGALSTNVLDSLHRLHRVDVLAYCLSERSTASHETPRGLIFDLGAAAFAMLLSDSMYPAYLAPQFVDEARLSELRNDRRRFDRLIELTDGLKNVRVIGIPWMPTVDAKAALYR